MATTTPARKPKGDHRTTDANQVRRDQRRRALAAWDLRLDWQSLGNMCSNVMVQHYYALLLATPMEDRIAVAEQLGIAADWLGPDGFVLSDHADQARAQIRAFFAEHEDDEWPKEPLLMPARPRYRGKSKRTRT